MGTGPSLGFGIGHGKNVSGRGALPKRQQTLRFVLLIKGGDTIAASDIKPLAAKNHVWMRSKL